jgi:threonine aldolase
MSLVTKRAEMPALTAGDAAEVGHLAGIAKHAGLRVHMNGARLANAMPHRAEVAMGRVR